MVKRERSAPNGDAYAQLGSNFMSVCEAMKLKPTKEDCFKVFGLALTKVAATKARRPRANEEVDVSGAAGEDRADEFLDAFVEEQCTRGEHGPSTVKAKDFFDAFNFARAPGLPPMPKDVILRLLAVKGIRQSLCKRKSVPALRDKMIFRGLNWKDQEEKTDVDVSTDEENVVESETCSIYVLELAGGKYYVGKTATDDVQSRIDAHIAGQGSAWTQAHPVIKLVKHLKNCSPFDEDKETIKLMHEHGWQNVRGGRYCQKMLSSDDVRNIETSIRGATDACLRCGERGHFARECASSKLPAAHQKCAPGRRCTRCGRNSHFVTSCYATTNLQGKYIGVNGAYSRDGSDDDPHWYMSDDDPHG